MRGKRVVLAYSGGLDTSVILHWLLDQGHEVVCFVGNIGQNEDFAAIRRKALQTGACRVYVEDLRQEFVDRFVFQALKANALYEGRYLLGTALARPLLARRQIEIAQAENTNYVAHGATGKGNDQVRFELAYAALWPESVCISPWKEADFLKAFPGRRELLAYAQKWGIAVEATAEKIFSRDENLMHISHEAGPLEDPACKPPGNTYRWTLSPQQAADKEVDLEIEFCAGVPCRVRNLHDGFQTGNSLELFQYLNLLGRQNGIGRIDIVENRFVGIKSRGVYETPAGTILWQAHRDLELLVLDREVLRLRDMLSQLYSELIYNGFWFAPETRLLHAFVDQSQETVGGQVTLSLYKGNVLITGRRSLCSLYDRGLASMEEEGGFNPLDALGFIRIHALRLKARAVLATAAANAGKKEENYHETMA